MQSFWKKRFTLNITHCLCYAYGNLDQRAHLLDQLAKCIGDDQVYLCLACLNNGVCEKH
ncbi:hypothetical protein BJX61DRAFT_502724 [Aspergillus egyptiacus]|nr:hypothetical protein BJX61DRAFT_502724 [Aspergillus egyptiacus]